MRGIVYSCISGQRDDYLLLSKRLIKAQTHYSNTLRLCFSCFLFCIRYRLI